MYYFLARLLVESGTQLTAKATNPDPTSILVPFLDQQECFLIYNSWMLYICNVWFFGRVIARAFLPYSFLAVFFFFFFPLSFLFFSPVFCRSLPPTSLTSLGPCLPPLFRSVYSSRFGSSAPKSICGRWVLSKTFCLLSSCVWERERERGGGGGGDTHTEKKRKRKEVDREAQRSKTHVWVGP